jgi:hypothetical protein
VLILNDRLDHIDRIGTNHTLDGYLEPVTTRTPHGILYPAFMHRSKRNSFRDPPFASG